MEKNNGRSMFSKLSSVYFGSKSPEKPDILIKTNIGGKSNDHLSSINSSNINLLSEKYNKDIELIRKMQKQGVIRKLSKKDSQILRKNNFLSDKDFEQVL